MTHFYTKDGTTAYGASLKEAREMGYLPSVTTIEDVLYNYGIVRYQIHSAILSALTLPKYDNETDSDYTDRIIVDSKQQARKAAKLGSVIHKLAERYISGKPLFFKGMRSDVWQLFEPLQKWIDDKGLNGKAEEILTSDHYAGKADYVDADIIIDFKTTGMTEKDVKKDGGIMKKKVYDSWGRQLAALQATSRNHRDCISVVISTNKDFPGVWCYYWSQLELDKHFEVFRSALNIYRIQKGLS